MSTGRAGLGLWVVGLVALFLAVTGVLWPFLDDEPDKKNAAKSDTYADSVQVASWEWRSDRTGSIFAVYGTVRNLGNQDLSQVVMQLRAEDQDGQEVGRYTILARNVGAGEEKPFRRDVPRTGKESTGFLEVKRTVLNRTGYSGGSVT